MGGFHAHRSSVRSHSLSKGSLGQGAFCARKRKSKISTHRRANITMQELTLTEPGIYQMSFSPNCIWREVVVVEVRTPAEEIGAPLRPNRLVLFVGTTGDAKFV